MCQHKVSSGLILRSLRDEGASSKRVCNAQKIPLGGRRGGMSRSDRGNGRGEGWRSPCWCLFTKPYFLFVELPQQFWTFIFSFHSAIPKNSKFVKDTLRQLLAHKVLSYPNSLLIEIYRLAELHTSQMCFQTMPPKDLYTVKKRSHQ